MAAARSRSSRIRASGATLPGARHDSAQRSVLASLRSPDGWRPAEHSKVGRRGGYSRARGEALRCFATGGALPRPRVARVRGGRYITHFTPTAAAERCGASSSAAPPASSGSAFRARSRTRRWAGCGRDAAARAAPSALSQYCRRRGTDRIVVPGNVALCNAGPLAAGRARRGIRLATERPGLPRRARRRVRPGTFSPRGLAAVLDALSRPGCEPRARGAAPVGRYWRRHSAGRRRAPVSALGPRSSKKRPSL